MTSIDHFAIATEIFGKQCIELSRPPHDVRFGNPHELVSVDCTTGRWRTTAQIRVGGKTVEMSGGYLKELGEIKKKNGGGDCRTILEEAARQAIAEAEAQQAADEECEAALAANRSDPAPDRPQADLPGGSQLQRKLRQIPPDEPKTAMRKEEPTTPPSDGLRTPRKAARKPRQSPPDGLKTAAQAAAKFGCSIKTLNGHVAAGDLRYVIIGKGTKRPHKMFTDADLNDFIANQTRTGSPACRSIASRVRRSGTSNFESEVIAFTGQPRPRPGAKPKR